ncbi:MAG TPA: TonB-dependent receptor [Pyrinomonadaceae bacterium]|nr:TonB-dependent receptor [Pyrinomonadaceae bacterium]
MRLANLLVPRGVFGLILILCAAMNASAQFNASIQGTVTDSAGAIVTGATVNLVNNETGQTQQAKTSDSGFYRFSALAPGRYTVTVEREGFKKQTFDNVEVSAEKVTGLDVQLTEGTLTETVTITADDAAILLQTEDANVGKVITTREILRLPQAGRDPYELARLTPGVFGTGARAANGNSVGLPNTSGPGGSNNSIFATENVQPISANGQRVSSNNYQIDGTSVNSQTWGGGAVITPTQESVKEVSVVSSTYSAEDGRNSGAQIKVVTKNGTNEWHGSGFFKLNNPSLNAFNKLPLRIGNITTDGPTRVERKYKTFGGSFGGPLHFPRFGEGGPSTYSGKNKLWFFFAYEGLTENTNNTFTSLVETPEFRSNLLAARGGTLTGRIISSNGVVPRIVQILPVTCAEVFVPCQVVSNGLDLGSITGTFGTYVPTFANPTGGGFDGVADVQLAQLTNPTSFRGNQFVTRIDYQPNENNRFTFTSFIVPNRATSSDRAAQSRPQADIVSERLTYAYAIIYNRMISPTKTNEARASITRWGFDETKTNPGADFGLPRIEIEGFFSNRLRFGFPSGLNTPGVIDEKQLDFRDTFINVVGNHVLKIGGDYRRDLNSNGEVGGARPLYSFHRLWNFANGTPIFEFVAATLEGKPSPNNTKFHTGELAFFVQDDWKFRPNLTLNLGLRWSYFSSVTAADGVIGNLLLGPDNGLAGARITTDKELYKKDLNNFGPQVAFAWNPKMFDEKLVIRGGGGIGYDRLANALLANARRNPPNGALFNICCGTAGAADGFGTPFVDGQIAFVASSDGTIFGYPANPNLGGGTNPATGLPNLGGVEIYGSPQDLDTAYVMRYSLEGQYELPSDLVATLGYQGSQGRHFVRILPLHFIAPTQHPNIGAAYFASPDVNSNYNAMITRLQGRLLRQFSFDANYRWSKSIDTTSFEGPCACTNQSFPIDQREERGPSDFDVTHSFVMSGVWDIPLFSNRSTLAGKLLGGWQLSGITTWNTGFPWTPKLFGSLRAPNGREFNDVRPTSYNGRQPLENTNSNFLQPGGIFPGGGTAYFGTTLVGNNPFLNRPGIGRNRFRGPRYSATDISIAKDFGLGAWSGERASLNVRFNFFNVFNQLNLSPFISNSDSTRVQSDRFGTATSALSGRVGEFQIRLSF